MLRDPLIFLELSIKFNSILLCRQEVLHFSTAGTTDSC